MDKQQLVEIANTVMPFGKYQGRVLIDLPAPYLLWFARKGEFPAGHLGELMQLTLAIKIEGLEGLVKPRKRDLLRAPALTAPAFLLLRLYNRFPLRRAGFERRIVLLLIALRDKRADH